MPLIFPLKVCKLMHSTRRTMPVRGLSIRADMSIRLDMVRFQVGAAQDRLNIPLTEQGRRSSHGNPLIATLDGVLGRMELIRFLISRLSTARKMELYLTRLAVSALTGFLLSSFTLMQRLQ